MTFGRILVVSDRLDGSRRTVEAFSEVAECAMVGPGTDWSGEPMPSGIVVDACLTSLATVRCLRNILARYGQPGPAILCILHGDGEDHAHLARTLGVRHFLPGGTSPADVVREMLRHANGGDVLVERVVERGIARTVDSIDSMFTLARAGSRLDVGLVRSGLDPLLEAVRCGGLSRWLDKVWAHDDATYRHCLLVAGLSATFAVRAGFGESDRRTFAMAALVHDVGKARIPLAVLNKPGRLDEGETELMRSHAALGHAILVEGGVTDPVVLAATRHHHEMLDGTGYPDGLSRDAISDVVRLLTVCDVYAALIERRPYRAPLSPAEAVHILSAMGDKVEQRFVQAFAATALDLPRGVAA